MAPWRLRNKPPTSDALRLQLEFRVERDHLLFRLARLDFIADNLALLVPNVNSVEQLQWFRLSGSWRCNGGVLGRIAFCSSTGGELRACPSGSKSSLSNWLDS
jgi:hypothetical protein